MYFTASIFVNLQLHVCIMKVILCHLQKKISAHKIACRAKNQFQGYLSNTMSVASKFLQTCQTMHRLSYILITGILSNKKYSRPSTF